MAHMTNLGGMTFAGVQYPLVLVDRFFRFYFDLHKAAFVTDVFRWDADSGEITYEVLASVPQKEGIDRSPNGVVVFASEDGGFQWKIRSGVKGRSELFGEIPAGEEMSVRFADKKLTVYRGNVPSATFQDGSVSGCAVGLRVYADGAISLGSGLPEGFVPPPTPSYSPTLGKPI